MYIPNDRSVTPPTLEYYKDARDAFLSDPSSALAALLIDHVRESRQNYLDQTRAEENHLRSVHAAQLEAMRDEADKLRDAGVARGVGMVASGALSIMAGYATANTPSSDASKCATPCTPRPAKGTDWPGVLNGAASGAKGGGELFAAYDDRQGQLARTRATEHEHQGGEAERRLKTLDETREHARDLERSAFEHLRNVHETEAATDLALVTWRG